MNWVAGQVPTANAVTAALSGSGTLSFYNLAGNVDLAMDVVGDYGTITETFMYRDLESRGSEVTSVALGAPPARRTWRCRP